MYYTMYTLYTLHTVHCRLYSVHCIVYSVQCVTVLCIYIYRLAYVIRHAFHGARLLRRTISTLRTNKHTYVKIRNERVNLALWCLGRLVYMVFSY